MARAVAKAEKLNTAVAEPEQSSDAMWIAMFERVARDKDVELSRLREIMNMRNEIEDRASKREFNLAMSAAQMELEPVGRKHYNSQTSSKYADLAAIAEEATPIISKHGFGMSFGTLPCERDGYIRMYCDLTNSGHEKRFESDIPLDDKGPKGNANKTQVHAFGSTTSYGRRYMMCMIFNIATKDNDGNAAQAAKSWDTINEDQQTILRDLLAETNTPLEKFLATGNPPPKSLADIPADQFEAAVTMLEGRRDKMRAKAKEAATNV